MNPIKLPFWIFWGTIWGLCFTLLCVLLSSAPGNIAQVCQSHGIRADTSKLHWSGDIYHVRIFTPQKIEKINMKSDLPLFFSSYIFNLLKQFLRVLQVATSQKLLSLGSFQVPKLAPNSLHEAPRHPEWPVASTLRDVARQKDLAERGQGLAAHAAQRSLHGVFPQEGRSTWGKTSKPLENSWLACRYWVIATYALPCGCGHGCGWALVSQSFSIPRDQERDRAAECVCWVRRPQNPPCLWHNDWDGPWTLGINRMFSLNTWKMVKMGIQWDFDGILVRF